MNIVIKKNIWHRKTNIVGAGAETHERLIRSPKPYPLGHIRRKF